MASKTPRPIKSIDITSILRTLEQNLNEHIVWLSKQNKCKINNKRICNLNRLKFQLYFITFHKIDIKTDRSDRIRGIQQTLMSPFHIFSSKKTK